MRVKLGDIAVLINGDRGKNYPSQADIVSDGDVPFVNAGHLKGIKIDFSEMNYISQEKYESLNSGKFVKGDILYCLRGSLGKKALVAKEVNGAIASSLVIIRPDSSKIIEEYLMYALDSPDIKDQLRKANNGSSQPNLSAASVREYCFELPDIETQQRIVERLTIVLDIISARQQEIQKLDELIKARFVEMFGKPIDNTMKWPIDRAENLCILVTDGSHFSPKACEEGYPMLSVKDMRQNGFDYSDCKLVDDETFKVLKKQGCVPQVDDVLIAKDGSYFTRAFPITEYKDQAILSSIGMYRPDLEKILPRFLASYLMTNEVVEFVNRGYVTGTALRRVIIKGLKNIPVYMPPIELQKQFVEFAEQVDKSKVVVQKALDKAQLLFDSLMQEYFG